MKYTGEYYAKLCGQGGKDASVNREIRRKLLSDARDDKGLQSELRAMCSRDILFYFNMFVWIYEPRSAQALPFVTWDFQDELTLQLLDTLGKKDSLIEKSRDMGVSWICIGIFEHQAHFLPYQTFGMFSSKAEAVDNRDDPKSLFWKLDHLNENLPGWLKPAGRMRTELKCIFGNKSSIVGEGISKRTTVGGRYRALLFDEFPIVTEGAEIAMRSRDTTNSRWFNGTSNGTGNKYYEIRQQAFAQKQTWESGEGEEPVIDLIRVFWTSHPDKSRGLYYNEKGEARSPAYDRELARCGDPREMAREWDIDYAAADTQFFDQGTLEEQMKAQCRPPDIKGELEYNEETGVPEGLMCCEKGFLHFWLDDDFCLDDDNRPPAGRGYSIGADVSVGTGSSNSALSVTDVETGRKVAAYAHAYKSEYEFARYAVALSRWFNDAFLIWERNGPGTSFGNEVLKLGYPNIFYEITDEKSVLKRYSDKPGWAPSIPTKRKLLHELKVAEHQGKFTNQCVYSHKERQYYVLEVNGSISHAQTVKQHDDPTKAKANHGDRVIADALSWRGCNERSAPEPEVQLAEYPIGSMGYRMKERKREELAMADA